MNRPVAPRQIVFDPTPEIFASDSSGLFQYPLLANAEAVIETAEFDEMRFVFSLWHPSSRATIDHDRAYADLRTALDPEEDHWTKLAEIEPVVPPYGAGESFDGWIILPVMAARSSFVLFGSGFEPRTRIQIRASVYLVA